VPLDLNVLDQQAVLEKLGQRVLLELDQLEVEDLQAQLVIED
jgi:hypothetical protein